MDISKWLFEIDAPEVPAVQTLPGWGEVHAIQEEIIQRMADTYTAEKVKRLTDG